MEEPGSFSGLSVPRIEEFAQDKLAESEQNPCQAAKGIYHQSHHKLPGGRRCSALNR